MGRVQDANAHAMQLRDKRQDRKKMNFQKEIIWLSHSFRVFFRHLSLRYPRVLMKKKFLLPLLSLTTFLMIRMKSRPPWVMNEWYFVSFWYLSFSCCTSCGKKLTNPDYYHCITRHDRSLGNLVASGSHLPCNKTAGDVSSLQGNQYSCAHLRHTHTHQGSKQANNRSHIGIVWRK